MWVRETVFKQKTVYTSEDNFRNVDFLWIRGHFLKMQKIVESENIYGKFCRVRTLLENADIWGLRLGFRVNLRIRFKLRLNV